MVYSQARKSDVDIILHTLGAIHPISKGLSNIIYKKTLQISVPENTVLLQIGEPCAYIYFIKKGVLMGKRVSKKKDIVQYISIENEFVSFISGMYGTEPSRETIVAVEACELLAFPNQELLDLFQKHFSINYIFRVMLEKYYRDAHDRSQTIRAGNAEERYHYFVHTKPGYMERLPLELVASMLDMKTLTLKKIIQKNKLLAEINSDTTNLYYQLNLLMQKEEFYKRKNVVLKDLANELTINTHKLSAYLNNFFHLSFVDFINTYRINNIKTQMNDANRMHDFTIDALAKSVGFGSRSAFYTSFKKIVGMSPLQYAKSLKAAKSAG